MGKFITYRLELVKGDDAKIAKDIKILQTQKQKAQEADNAKQVCACNLKLKEIFLYANDHKRSINCCVEILKTKDLLTEDELFQTFYDLIDVLTLSGQFNNALDKIIEYKDLANQRNRIDHEIEALCKIGRCYIMKIDSLDAVKSDFDCGINSLKEALQFHNKQKHMLSESRHYRIRIYTDLGTIYLKRGLFVKALKYLDYAIGLVDSKKDSEMKALAIWNKILVLQNQDEFSAALALNETYRTVINKNQISELKRSFDLSITLHCKLFQFSNAISDYHAMLEVIPTENSQADQENEVPVSKKDKLLNLESKLSAMGRISTLDKEIAKTRDSAQIDKLKHRRAKEFQKVENYRCAALDLKQLKASANSFDLVHCYIKDSDYETALALFYPILKNSQESKRVLETGLDLLELLEQNYYCYCSEVTLFKQKIFKVYLQLIESLYSFTEDRSYQLDLLERKLSASKFFEVKDQIRVVEAQIKRLTGSIGIVFDDSNDSETEDETANEMTSNVIPLTPDISQDSIFRRFPQSTLLQPKQQPRKKRKVVQLVEPSENISSNVLTPKPSHFHGENAVNSFAIRGNLNQTVKSPLEYSLDIKADSSRNEKTIFAQMGKSNTTSKEIKSQDSKENRAINNNHLNKKEIDCFSKSDFAKVKVVYRLSDGGTTKFTVPYSLRDPESPTFSWLLAEVVDRFKERFGTESSFSTFIMDAKEIPMTEKLQKYLKNGDTITIQ